MADEQVEYLWQCGKCGATHEETVMFCTHCAATEGAENAAALPDDKVGKITEAMMGAIKWSLQHGQLKTEEVLSHALKRGKKALTVQALRVLPLAELDQLAGTFSVVNRLGATGTGFTAGLPGGLAGFVAIPADIAAVIYFSIRSLSGISQSYGFETNSEIGQTVQLLAFAYACRFETMKIGQRRLENFALARYLLENPPSYSALVRPCLLKQLANYLAIDFAKTSWATFLPVIGGVVNGTNNFFFLGDVSSKGRVFYRSLYAGSVSMLPAPAPTPVEKQVITIEVREIKLPLPGGELKAHLVSPEQLVSNSLVLVLWNDEMAERLSENGFVTLAPLSAPNPAQIQELVAYLTENCPGAAPSELMPGKPALLASGEGTNAALGLLTERPDSLAAAVLYSPVGESREVVTNVPVLLMWGEDDPDFDSQWPTRLHPRDHNGLVSATGYSKAGKDFANPDAPGYNPKAAKWAWADTVEWLTKKPGQVTVETTP